MATRRRPGNLTAYDLYMRAMHHFMQFNREGLAEAIRLAHRALGLDPRFGALSLLWQVRVTQPTSLWATLTILNSSVTKQFG
jgi:hypothetical protein